MIEFDMPFLCQALKDHQRAKHGWIFAFHPMSYMCGLKESMQRIIETRGANQRLLFAQYKVRAIDANDRLIGALSQQVIVLDDVVWTIDGVGSYTQVEQDIDAIMAKSCPDAHLDKTWQDQASALIDLFDSLVPHSQQEALDRFIDRMVRTSLHRTELDRATDVAQGPSLLGRL